MEGTNKGQDNGEAMALVGVRLTAQLGDGFWALALRFIVDNSLSYLTKFSALFPRDYCFSQGEWSRFSFVPIDLQFYQRFVCAEQKHTNFLVVGGEAEPVCEAGSFCRSLFRLGQEANACTATVAL